jgi:hypothetical protein
VDGAGAPVRPPLVGAETQAGGRQYWASGVSGLGVPEAETDGGGLKALRRILRPDGAETDGGGPKARRRILRPDGAETDGGGPKAHRRILRPDGPVDRAGPVPEGSKTRLPPRRKASSGIFRECTVAVEGYYCKLCKNGS